MQTIHLMVGVPGTGKSTWIETVMENMTSARCISRDKVRASINQNIDENYFEKEKAVFAEFVRQINEAIKDGVQDIFIDATHINSKSRAKILRELRPKAHTTLMCEVIDVSLDTAMERSSRRSGWQRVPDTVIQNMWESFKAPTEKEFSNNTFGFERVVIRFHKEG